MSSSHSDKSKDYARIKRLGWCIDLFLSFTFLSVVTFGGMNVALRSWITGHTSWWPIQVILFCLILGGIFELIQFPLHWFRSFVVEHRFGLSNQNFPKWLTEYGKQLVIGSLLGIGIVESLSFLLRHSQNGWWTWATGAWMAWSIFLTWGAPAFLIPLFYRQTPLGHSALRERLEKLLAQCHTKVEGIFELNLSTTTKKGNACLCGMGRTRRVLVSDTLLSSAPIEEIEVVLAHEVGHHRFSHLWILILTSTGVTGAGLFVIGRILRSSCASLGLTGLSDLATLTWIALLLQIFSLLMLPLTNGLSRRLEKQADLFALEQTKNPKAFIATMQRLAEQNLAEHEPPAWVEWLLYDHPSISKRIACAQRFQK